MPSSDTWVCSCSPVGMPRVWMWSHQVGVARGAQKLEEAPGPAPVARRVEPRGGGSDGCQEPAHPAPAQASRGLPQMYPMLQPNRSVSLMPATLK